MKNEIPEEMIGNVIGTAFHWNWLGTVLPSLPYLILKKTDCQCLVFLIKCSCHIGLCGFSVFSLLQGSILLYYNYDFSNEVIIIIAITVIFLFLICGIVICRNLRDDTSVVPYGYVEPLELHEQVLRCNPEAFECSTAGKQSTRLLFYSLEYVANDCELKKLSLMVYLLLVMFYLGNLLCL